MIGEVIFGIACVLGGAQGIHSAIMKERKATLREVESGRKRRPIQPLDVEKPLSQAELKALDRWFSDEDRS